MLGADPRGFPGAFPWTLGSLRRDRSRWLGREGRLQVQQQSEAVTHSKLGLLCPGEGQSRSHPVHSFEVEGRVREQKTPLLAGKEAKPDNTDNKKSQKGVTESEISAATLSRAPMDRQTDMWAGQTELFVLASERAKARFAIQFAMYNNTALYTSLRCCLLRSSIN